MQPFLLWGADAETLDAGQQPKKDVASDNWDDEDDDVDDDDAQVDSHALCEATHHMILY